MKHILKHLKGIENIEITLKENSQCTLTSFSYSDYNIKQFVIGYVFTIGGPLVS